MWWHATCNLQPYTVAVGAQTWDREKPRFAARAEDEASQQPGYPATQPLNGYQHSLTEDLSRGVTLPPLRPRRSEL